MNPEFENIQALPNTVLLEQTDALVKDERRIGVAILHRLAEISRRRLHLELGYSSMFKYCTDHLKYPGANTCRLLDSMNLLLELPEIESKIESGILSVSTISQVGSYVRAQKRENGLTVTVEEKKKILRAVEGYSNVGTEKILAALHPEHPLPEQRESERVINGHETGIKFIAHEDLLAKLKRIEDLMAHTNWSPTYAELFDRMAEIVLDKIDPVRVQQRIDRRKNKIQQSRSAQSTRSTQSTRSAQSVPPVELRKKTRYIQSQVARAVWIKAGSQCTYVCTKTQKRCSETKGLQIDHCLVPWARGGSNEIANLTLRCSANNALSAVHTYGIDKMAPFFAKA